MIKFFDYLFDVTLFRVATFILIVLLIGRGGVFLCSLLPQDGMLYFVYELYIEQGIAICFLILLVLGAILAVILSVIVVAVMYTRVEIIEVGERNK